MAWGIGPLSSGALTGARVLATPTETLGWVCVGLLAAGVAVVVFRALWSDPQVAAEGRQDAAAAAVRRALILVAIKLALVAWLLWGQR